MEKPKPRQQVLWTYLMIQRRKKRVKKAQQRGDMEARQVLIERNIKAKNRHYKSSRR